MILQMVAIFVWLSSMSVKSNCLNQELMKKKLNYLIGSFYLCVTLVTSPGCSDEDKYAAGYSYYDDVELKINQSGQKMCCRSNWLMRHYPLSIAVTPETLPSNYANYVYDPHTFDAGEGVLIPGEILHHAEHGCRAFVILQPFGCLPNHVVGRGIVKKMREMYPDAQILPLDYDPDVSFANLENRLQMLIMNVKERSVDTVALPDVGQRSPVETMNRKQKNADNKKQKVS